MATAPRNRSVPEEPGRPPLATVAVSDCLRGRRVRWDGDHNGETWPRRTLERLFTLVGICPEVGIGMGVPREPIQLIGEMPNPRAVAVADPGLDYTARLVGYVRSVASTLDRVDGYIFADHSPSCGLKGVKVFGQGGYRRIGRGIYAAAVVAAHPTLPVVDAETLVDEEALLDFAAAVVAHRAASGSVPATPVRDTIKRLLNEQPCARGGGG